MNQQIKDIHGNTVNIGDIILLAKHSDLYKAKFLGVTPKAIKVSCKRQKFEPYPGQDGISKWSLKGKWIDNEKGRSVDEPDLSKHNSYKRLWINTRILKLN